MVCRSREREAPMETSVGDVAESARDGRGEVGGHGENVVVRNGYGCGCW